MADPERLRLPLHPCNECGAAPEVIWYSWRDPGYHAQCPGCATWEDASTPEALQALWDRLNPSTDVGSLRNSAAQRAVEEAQAAARAVVATSLLTQRLTPEVLEMLISALAGYGDTHDHDWDDFDPGDFIEWCCTMGNKPCPHDIISGLLEEPLYG